MEAELAILKINKDYIKIHKMCQKAGGGLVEFNP